MHAPMVQSAMATAENVASRRPAGAAVAVRLERDFDFGSTEYRQLFDRADATAFQHPVWLEALHRHLAPARGATNATVAGRDASGTLLFVLPLIRRRMTGVDLVEAADLGVGDYCAPVVDRSFATQADLPVQVASALDGYDILRLKPARPDAADAWRQFFDARATTLDFGAHATDLAPSYDAWRARAYQPAFAKYLDRRRKRFWKAEGASLRRLTDEGEIGGSIEAIRDLRAGRFDGDPIQQRFVADFYAEVALRGTPSGYARVYVLDLGGETIGHVFALAHRGRLHYLLIGCDYERHGRHSPGLVMYDAMIAEWIGEGGTVFDFTIGDEPFKMDFGTVATPMAELVATPTWKGRLARAAIDARAEWRRLRQKRSEAAVGAADAKAEEKNDP